jgi:hypothetical protein
MFGESLPRGFLLISATATAWPHGPGSGGVLSGYGYKDGMVFWTHSAYNASADSGSASGTLYGRPHQGMPWYPISSFAVGGANSGSAILSANYGHLMASAVWISASAMLTVFAQYGR